VSSDLKFITNEKGKHFGDRFSSWLVGVGGEGGAHE
jgi:hypothetical protein